MLSRDTTLSELPRTPARPRRGLVRRLVGNSPARLSITAFLVVIAVATALLSLPAANQSGHSPGAARTLFTATSAVTVTGLTSVSTAEQWTFFGQLVILLAVQIGGLGTLTMTSLLAMALGRKLGLRTKLFAQEGLNITAKQGSLGEVTRLLRTVVTTSAVIEASIAVVLSPRFLALGEPLRDALWHGVFYSVSAFNNAGFTPHSDGLVPYGTDWWILVPLAVGVWVGSLGFPVILFLRTTGWRMRRWNLTTRITVIGSVGLTAAGALLWGAAEWNRPETIGREPVAERVLHSLFASVMTRSGGFNLVDMDRLSPIAKLLTDLLMFVGGGSASTAGGIKVTTAAVILLAILAEARGDAHVTASYRTIPDSVLRIAITVVMLSATLVLLGTAALLVVVPAQPFDRVLFEVVSAYATCGLSVGLSGVLPPAGLYVLSVLMFIGRLGTVTVATGLALRSRTRLYKLPEERPLIG